MYYTRYMRHIQFSCKKILAIVFAQKMHLCASIAPHCSLCTSVRGDSKQAMSSFSVRKGKFRPTLWFKFLHPQSTIKDRVFELGQGYGYGEREREREREERERRNNPSFFPVPNFAPRENEIWRPPTGNQIATVCVVACSCCCCFRKKRLRIRQQQRPHAHQQIALALNCKTEISAATNIAAAAAASSATTVTKPQQQQQQQQRHCAVRQAHGRKIISLSTL